MNILKGFLILGIFLFSIVFVCAEASLDISLDKNEYEIGDNMTYNVLFLDSGNQVNDVVNVIFSDALESRIIEKEVVANSENTLYIDSDFLSGYWNIQASYKDKNVKRVFLVKENSGASFNIENDKLIIQNDGNVDYRKRIQIIIGDKIVTQDVILGVGERKEISLVAPDGEYTIRVTDGEKSIVKENVYLTGNVIGARSSEQESGTLLGGARDANGENVFQKGKILVSLVFVGAVFGLGLLVLVEKVASRRKRK